MYWQGKSLTLGPGEVYTIDKEMAHFNICTALGVHNVMTCLCPVVGFNRLQPFRNEVHKEEWGGDKPNLEKLLEYYCYTVVDEVTDVEFICFHRMEWKYRHISAPTHQSKRKPTKQVTSFITPLCTSSLSVN